MPFRINCPKCQAPFVCPDENRGKRLQCSKCGQQFLAGSAPANPAPASASPSPQAVQTQPNRPTAPDSRKVAPSVSAPNVAPQIAAERSWAKMILLGLAAGLIVGMALGSAGTYWIMRDKETAPTTSQATQTAESKPPPEQEPEENPKRDATEVETPVTPVKRPEPKPQSNPEEEDVPTVRRKDDQKEPGSKKPEPRPELRPEGRSPPPARGPLDLTYVAADFDAAAVVYPSRMLASPVLKEVPQEKVLEGLVGPGFDLRTVDQAIVLLEANRPALDLVEKAAEKPAVPAGPPFDPTKAKEWATLQCDDGGVTAVTFVGRGPLLAAGEMGGTVRLFDTAKKQQRAELRKHNHEVYSLATTPDGKTLVSAAQDTEIVFWDAVAGKPRGARKADILNVKGLAISPDGKNLISTGLDSEMHVWDVDRMESKQSFKAHEDPAIAIALSPDGKTLASTGQDDKLKLWDMSTGKEKATITGGLTYPYGLAFSPDGRILAVSHLSDIRLYDTASRQLLTTLEGHKNNIRSLAFSPDGQTLASGSDDKTVKLWSMKPAKEVATLTGHKKKVRSVAFSADGQVLASGSEDGTVKLWGAGPPAVQAAPAESAGPPLTPFFAAAIVRFNTEVKVEQTMAAVLKDPKPVSFQGKSYFKSATRTVSGEPCAWMPDDRTLLIAPEPTLRKMMSSSAAQSPLIDRLRTMPANDVSLVLFMGPYRKIASAWLQENKAKIPDQLAGLTNMPDRLEAVTLTVNLAGDPVLTLGLEGRDAAAAGALEESAKASLDFLKLMWSFSRATLIKDAPPAVSAQLLPLGDQLHGGVLVKREGTGVLVSLRRPEGFGVAPPKDLIAASGFNNLKGINRTPVPDTPFPLGVDNRPGGDGEPGWAGPWSAAPKAKYQTETVFEGDGALKLELAGVSRRLAEPQSGSFIVEQYVRLPSGGNLVAYVKNVGRGPATDAAITGGPMWQVRDGKFMVLDGNEQGDGKWPDTGLRFTPDKWHKVTLRINPAERTWEFQVDDSKYQPASPLRFRTRQSAMDTLDYHSETQAGAYIDAVRVLRRTEESK
jgi:hypothetical protein